MTVSETKLGEAKEALERGDFERAFRAVEEAVAQTPDDSEARELYAVTHLAKAIRLSDRAREARRQELIRRAIEYDVEFEDTPDVTRPRSSLPHFAHGPVTYPLTRNTRMTTSPMDDPREPHSPASSSPVGWTYQSGTPSSPPRSHFGQT